MTARQMLAGVLVLLAVDLGAPPERALEAQPAGLIRAVGAVGMTVGNMERSIAFYSDVLGFERVSEVELWGEDYERLQVVFGLRIRVVRMRLGGETIELTEYLTPRGRPIPVDSRSHDRWFQHIAIIVSDIDRAYASLRQHRVEHAPPAPQRLPDWNANAGGIRAFYFKDPDGHPLEILWFPVGKGDLKWHRQSDSVFLGIDTIRRSSSATPRRASAATGTRSAFEWQAKARTTDRSKSA
jgi:catechol 2,3-dioxygenase-like lactoylglutathione lyase family enzyme